MGAALAVLMPIAAHAQDPIKIGFITTFSGPGGAVGQDLAGGFKLALKSLNNQLGADRFRCFADDEAAPDEVRLQPSTIRLQPSTISKGGEALFRLEAG